MARAIVVEPKVLLMDEPLSNLDALLRLQFRAELKALADKNDELVKEAAKLRPDMKALADKNDELVKEAAKK